MGSSLTVTNDVLQSTDGRLGEMGQGVGCDTFWQTADAEIRGVTFKGCARACVDMTYSVHGMPPWTCGHIYFDVTDNSPFTSHTQIGRCRIYNTARTCKASELQNTGGTDYMFTIEGYRAETVYVKCGAHWSYMTAAISAALGFLSGGLGIAGVATSGVVSAIDGIASIAGAGVGLITPGHDQQWISPAEMQRVADVLENEWTKLLPGEVMPRHWGTLSLLQECHVLRSSGQIYSNAVYTGPWHDSNNNYLVSTGWGGLATFYMDTNSWTPGRRLEGGEDSEPMADFFIHHLVPKGKTPLHEMPKWMVPDESPTDEETHTLAIVDFLVGSWDPKDSTCDEANDKCHECVHCISFISNPEQCQGKDTAFAKECERCYSTECQECVPELPCLVEDFAADAKTLLGEKATPSAELAPCLKDCQACLLEENAHDSCEKCDGCEDVVKGTARLLIYEAERVDEKIAPK